MNVHIKEPLLVIGSGGSGFSISLSDWSFTILGREEMFYLTTHSTLPYYVPQYITVNKNVLRASLNEILISFQNCLLSGTSGTQ